MNERAELFDEGTGTGDEPEDACMSGSDDSVLSSSLREALFVLAIWLAATVYTVGYCVWRGYGRPWETVSFVFGFPDWVFSGIVCPWLACMALSWWFAYRFMRDESLGDDPAAPAPDGCEEPHDAH